MKGIKIQLVKSFLIVIFSAVIVLDLLLSIFIRRYYYDNAEMLVRNQIKISVNFYNKYFSFYTLEEAVNDNIDSFWDQSDAQVQLYDTSGKLLMDSIGSLPNNIKQYSDVTRALEGEKNSKWIGKVDYYDYKVMAVSSPIEVGEKTIGVIRFIVSLKSIDRAVTSIVISFVFVSSIVLILGIIISILIAKGIIKPIEKLTSVAEQMADGNLNVRSNIKENDEIGKLANTLDYMAEELQQKDKLKNEFISSVSHELRTPLTSIKGWAITLDDEQTDKETLKLGLNIIEKETDRLGVMVEELLDFSKLINGKIVLNKENVNMREFITHMQATLELRAKREKKIFNIKSNMIDETAYFDKDKMKQVLINLADNAFKFSDTNSEVYVNIIKKENTMIISVKDNGSGISKEDLPRVTEKFYKGKNVKSQNGIGLSICDEITKLHGGSIKIESELEKGTCVYISIPIDK